MSNNLFGFIFINESGYLEERYETKLKDKIIVDSMDRPIYLESKTGEFMAAKEFNLVNGRIKVLKDWPVIGYYYEKYLGDI